MFNVSDGKHYSETRKRFYFFNVNQCCDFFDALCHVNSTTVYGFLSTFPNRLRVLNILLLNRSRLVWGKGDKLQMNATMMFVWVGDWGSHGCGGGSRARMRQSFTEGFSKSPLIFSQMNRQHFPAFASVLLIFRPLFPLSPSIPHSPRAAPFHPCRMCGKSLTIITWFLSSKNNQLIEWRPLERYQQTHWKCNSKTTNPLIVSDTCQPEIPSESQFYDEKRCQFSFVICDDSIFTAFIFMPISK